MNPEFVAQAFFIFILGLFIGSFLNVVIYRIPIGKSIMFPYSHCTICRHVLDSSDLIPVLSFLLYKRKCRYCGEKISWIYPIIEILTGILFLICFVQNGLNLKLAGDLVLISAFVSITMIDLRYFIIPDRITFTIGAGGFLFSVLIYLIQTISPEQSFQWISISDSLLGILTGLGIFIVLIVVSKGGMGFGDAKMAGMMGAIMGMKSMMVSVFLAFIFGAVIGSFLLITRIKNRKDAIPFGPYIALGGLMVIYFGADQILLLYRNFMDNLIQ